jgi:hypothetical protein
MTIKLTRRILSLTLATLMLFVALPLTASAAVGKTQQETSWFTVLAGRSGVLTYTEKARLNLLCRTAATLLRIRRAAA